MGEGRASPAPRHPGWGGSFPGRQDWEAGGGAPSSREPRTGAAPAALQAAERGPVRMAFGEDGKGCRGAVLSPPGLGAVTSAGLACSDGPVPARQGTLCQR